ncbi:MAG TPA: hypothetical protein VF064_10590 [Pyrinomonadaceae bacterium]
MSKLCITLTLAALACFVSPVSRGQTAPPQQAAAPRATQQHLIGEVTAIDQAAGLITVRTDAGATVNVKTDERTLYRRLPPGETSLQKAEQITRADLRAGDRVLVPGALAAGEGATVQQVIVTAREAASERREREDWRRRGVAGRVVALDEGRKTIVLETRGGRDAARAVTVDAADAGVRFLRYAPDSFRRADARPGAFPDIAVGDQLRALGERSADGSRVKAEEVVSGTVERIVGAVTSVDLARGEVSVKNEQTGQTVVITVGRNTTLRRVPREVAEELAARSEQREARRGERDDDAQRREERRNQRREERRRENAADDSTAPQSGGGQRARPAGRSVQQIFASLPVIKVEDLKKGDTAVVTATVGEDAARATAVSLIAGEASMLRWLQRFQRVADDLRDMTTGLPGTVMGGNTGSNDEP